MTVQEATGVQEVIDGIAKAWADNDPNAFADLYTADASMILSGDRYGSRGFRCGVTTWTTGHDRARGLVRPNDYRPGSAAS